MDTGTHGTATFTPYGPWATLALTVAVLIGASLLTELLLLAASGALPGKGQVLASILVSSAIGTGALLKLVEIRAPGFVTPYLALRWSPPGAAARWLGVISAYLVMALTLSSVIRGTFEITPPPTVFDEIPVGPLFLFAVVVAAPVFEETLFRGFMMMGLMPSQLGNSGAVVLSTLAWTLLHVQYDLIGMLMVFGCGMILALARLYTGSLLLCVVMHGAFNALSILISTI